MLKKKIDDDEERNEGGDDDDMEFDEVDNKIDERREDDQPSLAKEGALIRQITGIRGTGGLNVIAMKGQIAQVLGDLDRQSFASRMDRGTIATKRGRDTIYQLKNRDDYKAVDLFERYEREETIGRDARLMSIALNKTYKRLSMRYIGNRVGTLYKPDVSQDFKARRETVRQNVTIINNFMDPHDARIEEKKTDIKKERIKLKVQKMGSPMWFTNFCVACPFPILIFSLILFTAAAVFGYISGHFELKPAHYREMYYWDDAAMEEWDMMESAKVSLLDSSNTKEIIPLRIQLLDKLTAQIVYQGQTGKENMLDKKYLLEIEEFEKGIKNTKQWDKLCWSGSNDGSCNEKAWMSPLQFLKNKDISKMQQGEINDEWWKYYHSKSTYSSSDYGLLYPHRDMVASEGKLTHMRTVINFGAPLEINGTRYKDLNDRKSEQFNFIKDFQLYMNNKARYTRYQDFDSTIRPQFYSMEVQNEETKVQSMNDTYYIAISVFFVYIWLTFHLKSTALSTISMLIIAFSFGTTGLICEYAVGMTYFNILNNFAIFVILGIAADDFFIFFDAWHQSGEFKGISKDLKMRMAYTMRRASRTMFMTSSTTAVAFLATCFSPIMTVRAFGIYSAILVPITFILTCWILPPAVILYERYNQECFCCLRINTSKGYNAHDTEPGETHRNLTDTNNVNIASGSGERMDEGLNSGSDKKLIIGSELANEPEFQPRIAVDKLDDEEEKADNEADKDEAMEGGVKDEGAQSERTHVTDDGVFDEGEFTKLSDLESFFGGFWNRWVYNCRFVIMVIFIVWTVFAVSKAKDIKPLVEQETYLPESNVLLKAKALIKEKFPILPSEMTNEQEVTFFFGVDSISKAGIDIWDPTDLGKVTFATDFDLSSTESQKSLKKFCDDLKSADFIQSGQVSCWLEKFEEYLNKLPIPLGIPISKPEDFNKNLLDFAKSKDGLLLAQNSTLIIVDDKLKYFQITATSKDRKWEEIKGNSDVYDSSYNFTMSFVEDAPQGLKSAKYAAEQFAKKSTEKALQDFAVMGIGISICFAFILLLLIVCNVIIAFISVVCVGIISASVIAIMVLKGYEIVVGESVSMIILTGLAVDYVIHLAQSYVFSPHKHRSRKIKHAYQEMGVSVFSGMVTTVGAAAFLFFGKIVLFEKFAVIIVSTCCVSFLTAMLFFGAAMHLFGPQNNWGNLIVCDSCFMLNPEGEDSRIREMEGKLEMEQAQPRNVFEMMQEGERQRSLGSINASRASRPRSSFHSENVDA